MLVWDGVQESLLSQNKVHADRISCLECVGSHVWSGSGDRTIVAHDAHTFQMLYSLNDQGGHTTIHLPFLSFFLLSFFLPFNSESLVCREHCNLLAKNKDDAPLSARKAVRLPIGTPISRLMCTTGKMFMVRIFLTGLHGQANSALQCVTSFPMLELLDSRRAACWQALLPFGMCITLVRCP